jgi:hypothetical protein
MGFLEKPEREVVPGIDQERLFLRERAGQTGELGYGAKGGPVTASGGEGDEKDREGDDPLESGTGHRGLGQ